MGLQACDKRRTARRIGTEAPPGNVRVPAPRSSHVSGSGDVATCAAPAPVIHQNGHAQALLDELTASRGSGGTGESADRTHLALTSVSELPASVWAQDVGKSLYKEMEWWGVKGDQEIKRL